jgi:hypothetical protein
MIPRPWSHSALETHGNCPWQYHEKYIARNLPPEEKSKQQLWGIKVHEKFDAYVSRPGNTLPVDLEIYKDFLDKLIAEGEANGHAKTECKVALGINPFGPCSYFAKNVWWRGIIDFHTINAAEGRAKIVDYKTGKKKDDWAQLAESALWIFAEYPKVNLINAQYYWTEDMTVTKKVWARSEMDTLVAMFSDKLAAYAHSFKTEVFGKKQSGLCYGYCPVTSCEFWKPKKERY